MQLHALLRLLDEVAADHVPDGAPARVEHHPHVLVLIDAELDEVVARAERAELAPCLRFDVKTAVDQLRAQLLRIHCRSEVACKMRVVDRVVRFLQDLLLQQAGRDERVVRGIHADEAGCGEDLRAVNFCGRDTIEEHLADAGFQLQLRDVQAGAGPSSCFLDLLDLERLTRAITLYDFLHAVFVRL